jgi:hypothetical protein
MKSRKDIYDTSSDFESIGDELKKIPKESPFSVPSDYFESLPEIIQSRLSGSEQKPVRFWTIKYKVTASMISIILAVMLIASYFLWNDSNGSVDPELFSGISLEEMLIQYPDYFLDIDEDLLIEVLLSSESPTSLTESDIQFDSTLTNEDIIRYLEEEDIDTEQIVNL